VAELLSSTDYSITPWHFASESHITCTADIRELGIRIWLEPDAASFGRAVEKGELVPEQAFEEWDYKLPEDFIEHFAHELQVTLRQGAA